MIVVIVTIVMLFISDDEEDIDHGASAWACTIALLIVLRSIPLFITYVVFKGYHVKGAKLYQFSICHHKLEAGAYARMLEMFLLDQPKVTRKVFVDSDDLSNLDRLFDIVGSNVETLVVLASKSVYVRPWCVGEIATAYLKMSRSRL